MSDIRPICKVVQGIQAMEGGGVLITRTIGTGKLPNVDPYIMLDELKLPAKQAFRGFPDHPHRGFETCSIMLEGLMEHRDSAGNKGVIGPGGVQWMTAGRGIIHSEMPKATEGQLWGFQLWINLPSKDKMVKPRYQDYQASDIPILDLGEGSSIRIMAGERAATQGPIKLRNPGLLFDVRLAPGAEVEQPVPAEWNGFVYVYHGAGTVSGTKAKPQQNLVLGAGDLITAQAGPEGLRFLLVAGRPINEPIVQRGPFVMNTMEEIYQAFDDYQSGRLQNPDDNVWEDWKE